jgi:hypothetical protein
MSTPPSTAEVLVPTVGMLVVALAALVVDSVVLATSPAFGAPAVMLPLFATVAAAAVALPRVVLPVPLGRVRSEDRTTWSPGFRFSRPVWAAAGAVAVALHAEVLAAAVV